MKIFVISDIHGSVSAFEKACECFYREKAEIMLICGDFLNHGPRNPIPEGYNPPVLAQKLNELKSRIACVKGNCDGEVDQMLIEFSVLDPTCQLFLPCFGFAKPGRTPKGSGLDFVPNGRIFVHHGHRLTNQQAAELTDEGTIIVSGHTHVPVLEAQNKRIYLNPGSITLPKGQSAPGYATIECTSPQTGTENLESEEIIISLKTIAGETVRQIKA